MVCFCVLRLGPGSLSPNWSEQIREGVSFDNKEHVRAGDVRQGLYEIGLGQGCAPVHGWREGCSAGSRGENMDELNPLTVP